MRGGAPVATVVVPTRDRPRALERCLRALSAQSAPVEVIVVDDGSRDLEAVAGIVADHGAALIRRDGGGPAAARNAGAAGAGAEVICFTDDDCEPDRGWAAALASAIEEGAPSAAGITVNADPANPLATASQLIATGLMLDSSDSAGGRLEFAPSCNLAIAASHRDALRFDEGFPLAAGEDREWTWRAGSLGLAPVLVPDARVRHHQRLSAGAFARQQLSYGRGAVRYRLARGSALAGTERRGFRRRLLRRAARDGTSVALAVATAQLLTAAGAAAEGASALKQRLRA